MKIALLGGGGFRAPMVYAGLLGRAGALRGAELVLHDLDDRRLARVAAVLEGMSREREIRVPFRTTTSLDDALEGADHILCAIRAGGARGRAHDERLAQDLGLLGQETVGASGLLFALRTIPVMTAVAEAAARRAPRAWLLNFTNPAGVVTEALRRVLGERAIGICDSPDALFRRVAAAIGRSPHELTFGYSGLNHLGWLNAVTDEGGVDLLPALLAEPARLAEIEEGRLFGAEWLQAIGMIPNEYLFYFHHTRRALAVVDELGRTRGETLLAQQSRFYDARDDDPTRTLALWREVRGERERTYLQEAGEGAHDVPTADEGGYAEVALRALEALTREDRSTVLVLNTANAGTLPCLDRDAVVEVPCLISAHGVRPIVQPPLPAHARGLVEIVKEVERSVLAAVLEGDRRALLKAMTLHPLCGGLDTAADLCEAARQGARAGV